jgi:hypothetical protein
VGPHRESEGFKEPSEGAGQHNPARGKGPCFVRATEGWMMRGLQRCSEPRKVSGHCRGSCTARPSKNRPAFYALYDKVYWADILSHAYELVLSNKRSPGIDGVTFEDIEAKEGAAAYVAELAEALRSKRYRPDPVKRVMIPKADGSERPLGIPTIRDRVAQMAVKLVIEPIFEAD